MRTHQSLRCWWGILFTGALLILLTRYASAIGPDAFGYEATTVPYSFEDISTTGTQGLSNNDDAYISAPIGFDFSFYGVSRSTIYISTNGLLSFESGNASPSNASFQTSALSPNVPTIAPLWDDWVTWWSWYDAVYYKTVGSPGNRRFIVQWHVVSGYYSSPSTVTFQAVLYEGSNHIRFSYLDTYSGDFRSSGGSATVGIRDTSGQSNGRNLQWSHQQPVIASQTAILFSCAVEPIAVNDAYATLPNRTLTVAAPGVLGNDIPGCGPPSPLTAFLVVGPSQGVLVFNPDGSFSYTPNAGATGTDSFTYRANNGLVDSNVATVTISIAVTLGMVADNTWRAATVFDADSGFLLGTVFLPTTGYPVGDCAITADGTLGFVTDFQWRVWVLDLTSVPPRLASGTNPIPISNVGEDLAITPDQRYLVVCDGSQPAPVAVVDIATRTQISTFYTGTASNSIDVCQDGSVLVTSAPTSRAQRLMIDSTGNLTDTGEVLSGLYGPMNIYGAPGSATGLVVSYYTRDVRSFAIPWLSPIAARALTGAYGICGAVNAWGNRVYGRSNSPGAVDAFAYDAATGALGATPLFTIPIANTDAFFGIDQLALHPNGRKLYVPQPSALKIHDASTGALLGSITAPGIALPKGVAIQPNRPPTATCPPARVVECTSPVGAEVTTTGSVGDVDGDALTLTWQVDGSVVRVDNVPASGPPTAASVSLTRTYCLGTHSIEAIVSDGATAPVRCVTTLTVQDTTAPTVSCSVGTSMLWPPNHKLVNVGLSVTATDACDTDPTIVVEQVCSNVDDEEQTGDGCHAPDAKDVAPGTLRLRAERQGNSAGRFYLIAVSATDDSGNVGYAFETVCVSKSESQADIDAIHAAAAAAKVYYEATGGPPDGCIHVGDGPVIGPKQ
ncbi:MAG: hypothetical protein HY320_00930 [Armatimonadetes bacterium]|nr:hypothetical protein [Armatimonadota bacterium]